MSVYQMTFTISEAQEYAGYLPEGVRLSEATKAQILKAIRDGRVTEAAL